MKVGLMLADCHCLDRQDRMGRVERPGSSDLRIRTKMEGDIDPGVARPQGPSPKSFERQANELPTDVVDDFGALQEPAP